MTEETFRRLKPKFDKAVELYCLLSGAEDYEKAVAMAKQQCRDRNSSPAPWLHAIARQIYPSAEQDSVPPEYFYEILTLLDTREKALSIFSGLPEEGVPEIEKFLDFFLKDLIPSWRSHAQQMAKKLPQRRRGGRPSTLPNEKECRAIWSEIEVLGKSGVKRGVAQKRIATKRGLSVRTVQRICAMQIQQCKEKWLM